MQSTPLAKRNGGKHGLSGLVYRASQRQGKGITEVLGGCKGTVVACTMYLCNALALPTSHLLRKAMGAPLKCPLLPLTGLHAA